MPAAWFLTGLAGLYTQFSFLLTLISGVGLMGMTRQMHRWKWAALLLLLVLWVPLLHEHAPEMGVRSRRLEGSGRHPGNISIPAREKRSPRPCGSYGERPRTRSLHNMYPGSLERSGFARWARACSGVILRPGSRERFTKAIKALGPRQRGAPLLHVPGRLSGAATTVPCRGSLDHWHGGGLPKVQGFEVWSIHRTCSPACPLVLP